MVEWYQRKQPLILPASAGIYADSFYYGVPWIEPTEDKHGNPIDAREVYIIASDPIHNAKWFNARTPPNPLLRFKTGFFPLRWSEESVKQYLTGETPALTIPSVFEKIRQQLQQYVELTSEAEYDLTTSWLFATYYLPLFQTFPIFHIHGFKECGKSHLLIFLALLGFNGSLDLPSSSALYRRAEAETPTLCIDDFEETFGKNAEKKEDFLRLLRVCYKRGNTISRVNKDKGMTVEFFEVFLPVALSNVKGMDDILSSRSIQLIMRRSINKRITQRTYRPTDPVWAELRNQQYVCALQNWRLVKEALDSFNEELYSREFELWLPLLSVAKIALPEDRYGALVAYAQKSGQNKNLDSEENPETVLLRVFARLHSEKGDRAIKVSNKALTDAFNAELGLTDKKDRPYSPKRVRKIIGNYGIKGDKYREGIVYSITPEQLDDTAQRYGVNLSVTASPASPASQGCDGSDGSDGVTESLKAEGVTKTPDFLTKAEFSALPPDEKAEIQRLVLLGDYYHVDGGLRKKTGDSVA